VPQPGGSSTAAHERLTYFTRGAEWSDRDVRREAARYALAAMTAREPVNGLDHRRYGLPEAGTHSVGVATTVFGTIGKIAQLPGGGQLDHCHTHGARAGGLRAVPARELDRGSIAAGRGPTSPNEVTFKTKPELGIEMIERAVADGLPAGAGAGRQRGLWRQFPSFAGACAARVWATAVGLHRTTNGVAPGFAGTPNR